MEARWPAVWGAVLDERICSTCRAMAGQALWSDAPFAPPAHDRCRCVLLRLPIDLGRLMARQRIELGVAMAERLGRLGPADAGGDRSSVTPAGSERRSRLPRSGSRISASIARSFAPRVLQGGSDATVSWLQRLSDAAFAAFNEAGGQAARAVGSGRSGGFGGFH
jgi:hypothetical protein